MKKSSFILSFYHITNGRIKNIRTVIEFYNAIMIKTGEKIRQCTVTGIRGMDVSNAAKAANTAMCIILTE